MAREMNKVFFSHTLSIHVLYSDEKFLSPDTNGTDQLSWMNCYLPFSIKLKVKLLSQTINVTLFIQQEVSMER